VTSGCSRQDPAQALPLRPALGLRTARVAAKEHFQSSAQRLFPPILEPRPPMLRLVPELLPPDLPDRVIRLEAHLYTSQASSNIPQARQERGSHRTRRRT
jgi:hypothetical protein